MQTRLAFALWPRLHQDLLRFLDLVPEGGLVSKVPGGDHDLGWLFRDVAASESYWRRAVLERDARFVEITAEDCPTTAALRQHLVEAFEGTEQLLLGSLTEALAERRVRTRFPVHNALEAIALSQIHTVHRRAQIVISLRTLGVDPEDWL